MIVYPTVTPIRDWGTVTTTPDTGTTWYYSSVWDKEITLSDIIRELKNATTECSKCEGEGEVLIGVTGEDNLYKKLVCPKCGGTGLELTEKGKELARLLEGLNLVVEKASVAYKEHSKALLQIYPPDCDSKDE